MKDKNKNSLIVVLVVLVALLFFGGLGMRSFSNGMMEVSNFGFALVNWLLGILLLILVILGILWLVKNLNLNQRRKD